MSVTSNGTYNAPSGHAYSTVDVNVSSQDEHLEDKLIMHKGITSTVSGVSRVYYNSRISYVGEYAFARAPNAIGEIIYDFPNASKVSIGAFYQATYVTSVNLPIATSLGFAAFSSCTSLTNINAPNTTTIGGGCFYSCLNLTSVSFSQATSIVDSAFTYCTKLSSIYLPNVISIGSSAFTFCSSLTTASFSKVTSIAASAFRGCTRLVSLYLTGGNISQVPSLGTSVFYSTPIGGYSAVAGQYGSVFVPSSLYSSFLTATNWKTISSRIVSV